jgi:type IX secretion system PorP/SprF family membrane protein
MRKIFLGIQMFILSLALNAQQDAMFTHYAYNTLAINPAYAGTRDALTVTGLSRMQWVNFDGAPVTQTLTLHTPIISQNIGLGVSVLNDKIGPTNNLSLYVDFSYKIKVSEKAHLSFGLKSGLHYKKADLNSLLVEDASDPFFMADEQSKLLPNFGFGLYYFTDKYYVGLSIPKLLENNFTENTVSGDVNLVSEQKHYFLIGGAVFKLSESIDLKPTSFLKITNGAPIELDITANFIFMDRFWTGIMYRTGDALGALAGINITDQFAVGYSFDWSASNRTFRYNQGSHEIMLRYDFIYKEKNMIRSPRYF